MGLENHAEGITVWFDAGVVNEARGADAGGDQDVARAMQASGRLKGIRVNDFRVVEFDDGLGFDHAMQSREQIRGITFA